MLGAIFLSPSSSNLARVSGSEAFDCRHSDRAASRLPGVKICRLELLGWLTGY